MPWVTPRVWAVAEELTSPKLNDISGNLTALAAVPATSLPGSPVDGQHSTLTDSTTVPTYAWQFVYSAAAAKWVFIGGSPKTSQVATSETTTSTTYAALTTAGPSVALPLAGTYEIIIGCTMLATGNTNEGNSLMSYDIGGTGAVDNDAVAAMTVIAASGFHDPNATTMRSQVKTGLTAVTLTAKYRNTTASNTVAFSQRFMHVRPVLIG
jgi:hypothetical protein